MIYINLTSLSEVLVSAFLQAAALSYITYGTQNKKTMVNTLKSCNTFEKLHLSRCPSANCCQTLIE